MNTFLHYFQDELYYLKQLAEEWGADYPELAQMQDLLESDADIAYIMEHFAFLSAQLRQKLEDGFPEITQNLLTNIWPVSLRPLPSCTVLQFTAENDREAVTIRKGAEVSCEVERVDTHRTGELAKTDYRFQLCRALTVQPIEIADITLQHQPNGSELKLLFRWTAPLTDINQFEVTPLYLGEDERVAGLLKLYLTRYAEKMSIYDGEHTYGLFSDYITPLEVKAESRIQPTEGSHFWPLQLVSEYFSLPNLTQFVQINWLEKPLSGHLIKLKEFTLQIQFSKRLPAEVTASQLRFHLNCVPAINLQEKVSGVYRFDKTAYEIEPEEGEDFYCLTGVKSINEEGDDKGERREIDYQPVSQFQARRFTATDKHYYYYVMTKKDVIERSRSTLQLIDSQGAARAPRFTGTFRYTYLGYQPKAQEVLGVGRLTEKSEAIPGKMTVRNITRLTAAREGVLDESRHWRIISLLSLSPSLLSKVDVIKAVLKELDLYAPLGGSEARYRCIEGIIGSELRLEDGVYYGQVVRVSRLIITLDSDCFADEGQAYMLGELISGLFSYCVAESNFFRVLVMQTKQATHWSFPLQMGKRAEL